MSSMSCLVGSPYIAHYGATKAYIRNIAEGL
jgi:short-subunit dehydrogenase